MLLDLLLLFVIQSRQTLCINSSLNANFKDIHVAGYIEIRNGNNGTISSIYKTQGMAEAGALKNLATIASGFITNDSVRSCFLGNIETFTEAQITCITGGNSPADKNQALSYLRQEQEYLERQISWLDSRQVQPAASVEIRIINGVLSYIVKGIGLIGGILQFVSGTTLVFVGSPTVVGTAVGALLVLHGINNIMESGASLFFNNDNYEGPATRLYEGAANLIGVDRTYGKLAFSGIDLALSSVALLGTKLVPDAWRLFQYIPADYEINFRLMSMGELAGELLPDSATIYSSIQTYFSLPVNEPATPANHLVPFENQ